MELERLKNGKERFAMLLLVISFAAGAAAVLRLANIFSARAEARMLFASAALSGADPNSMDSYFAASKAMADELKKKNLFAPPPPRQHPVKAVSGILGSEALINGAWHKAGAKIGDAEIICIEPTQVKIKWDGSEKWFAPLAAASSPASSAPVIAKSQPAPPEPKQAVQVAKVVETKPIEPAKADDPFAWLGVTLSDSMKAKMLAKWNELTDSQKEQVKQQWSTMSDEQKQQAVSMMEQNL